MSRIDIAGMKFDDVSKGLPRNPGALSVDFFYEHRIISYKIAGYKDLTQCTSNVVLLNCTVTLRTTDAGGKGGDGFQKFLFLQQLIKSAGPYKIQTALWGPTEMYLQKPKFTQSAGEDEWVGTWTLPFVELSDK